MSMFIFKTEPSDYAYADLVRDGRTPWDGITNPGALKHLRSARPGDLAFIYHTATQRAIVGLGRILTEPYPDPNRPELTKAGQIKYPLVDIEPVAQAPRPVTLAQIKQDPRFEGFTLIREARLSVVPVPAALGKILRSLAGFTGR